MTNSKGPSRDQKNLDYWSRRAERNSEIAPRAARKMELPPTGKMELRDTSKQPYVPRKVNRHLAGD